MLMLEVLARALVEKLEARHDVDLDTYAHLKSWIEATDQERLDCPNIVKRAQELHASDDLEIDDDPFLSPGEDGKWVSAWVWVPNPDTEGDE